MSPKKEVKGEQEVEEYLREVGGGIEVEYDQIHCEIFKKLIKVLKNKQRGALLRYKIPYCATGHLYNLDKKF